MWPMSSAIPLHPSNQGEYWQPSARTSHAEPADRSVGFHVARDVRRRRGVRAPGWPATDRIAFRIRSKPLRPRTRSSPSRDRSCRSALARAHDAELIARPYSAIGARRPPASATNSSVRRARPNRRSVLAAIPENGVQLVECRSGVGPRRPELPQDRLDAFPLGQQSVAGVDDEFDR